MQFTLVHTEVSRLRLSKVELSEENVQNEEKDSTFTLGLNVLADPKRSEIFGVFFNVEMVQQEEFSLELTFVAWFESPEPLAQEQISSPFARINAPAIAFPYLRSFISLLTLNSGFKPVILSTVNFIEMFKEFEASKEQTQ